MSWASSALADVNSSASMPARSWVSSALPHVNSLVSMSALPLWHDVPELFDVNSLLRCLAALADVHSADVGSSLRCLLHCVRHLDLDVCTASRRGWEKVPLEVSRSEWALSS